MHLQWQLPGWLWLLVLGAAVACALWIRRAYAGSEPRPPLRVRRWLAGLRLGVCLLVLLAFGRPLLIAVQTLREPAHIAVVVEDSHSMTLRDRPDGPDRWRESWRLAAAVDSVVGLRDGEPVVGHWRGNGRLPLRQTEPAVAVADTPRAVGTDLSAIVAQVRQSLLARPLRGIVVLSDGHSDSQPMTAEPPGLPLWLVGVGDVAGPADRFLADLRHVGSVQRGEPLTVEVVVAQRGAAAQAHAESLTVRLLQDGESVAVKTGPAADLTRWELTWTGTQAGLAVLEVEVSALDNERFLANNRVTFAVDVQPDRARVLILAPVPGWDLRFLSQAAHREQRLDLQVVRPGPSGPILASSGAAWTAPNHADQWRQEQEAVVLVGPPGAWLPDAGQELAAAVRQGLGLLAIAGDPGTDVHPRQWPAALRGVLPVAIGGSAPQSGQWQVKPAPQALRHPILAGITHGEAAAGLVASWPPLQRLQPGRVGLGAEVLLQAGSDEPLLVSGSPEQGRSLWFGGRCLWNLAFWRLPGAAAGTAAVADAAGRRLLQQMLLWIALGDQLTGISLLEQRLVFEEGETLPVAARWLDLRGEAVTGRPLAVEVARPDGKDARVHALRPDPSRPGIAVGELPPLPPGRWRLTPQSLEAAVQTGPAREIVVTAVQRELAQVRQDWRNLRQTAARLGGVALDASRPEHEERLLAALGELDLRPHLSQRQSRREPTAGWTWLGLTIALLAAEWLLRRRHGLL